MLNHARTAPPMTARPGPATPGGRGETGVNDPFALPPVRGRIGDTGDEALIRDALLGLGLVSLGLALAGIVAGAMVLG